jgi:tripartite ATP-independent transporter DctM subunit
MGVAVLVSSFVVLMAIGVPVAFCIALATVGSLLVSVDITPAASTVAHRVATGLDSFTLLAIPFFVLAGVLMGRGGIARRLIELARGLVGSLPGGLAFVNVIASMLFGAISGSAIAAAVAIGGVMHPKMVENGYSPGYSAAVNVTAATTGLIIPPSNVLIVYSLASGGVSIAALFIAGYLPGLLLGFSLMLVAGVIAYRKGYPTAARLPFTEVLKRFGDAALSLSLIVIIIGGIVGGIFTATEAAAIAVVYALFLSMVVYREVRPRDLPRALLDAALTTSVVMLLIGTSMGLSWLLSYQNIPQSIGRALTEVSQNRFAVLMIINVVLLVVGIFMDMTPAILIFTPIFLPVVTQLGVDPIHFGIIMVFNLCIGLCTPPVGTVLFAGCGVASVPISQIVRPLMPLYAAMFAALLLITYIPEITLALPRWLGF